MKVLNLINKEASDIKFEVSSFPDGQQQVKITGQVTFFNNGNVAKDIAPFRLTKKFDDITIKARLNNFRDLELIICATQSLKELGVNEIHLYVPYFLGSRSDRKFEEGSNNYLKHVICPIINSQGYKSVTVLDPHSDVLEACLNGFKKVSNKDLVLCALCDMYCPAMKHGPLYTPGLESEGIEGESDPREGSFILISPDAGASKKIYKLAEQIGYKGDIITCSKDRDENGKLTRCVVPISRKHCDKDLVIIDDIADGAGTFINIAKEVKNFIDEEYTFTGKLYLIVTHGIFSKGFNELTKYFDGIYTTNSYSEFRAFEDSDVKYCGKLVKHLNVF
jgi:ribose-phosphate pyrophosphokinase